MRNDNVTLILEDFLWSGGSACLVAIAHLSPDLWPMSLVALLPFLWRVSSVSYTSALRLGVLLALSYGFVSVPIGSLPSLSVLTHVLVPGILFSGFALAVNRLASRVGLNAVFTAVLWLPVEYLLDSIGPLGGLFTPSHSDSAALVRIGSLLGTLMVSFAFVLINALLLAVIARVVRARPQRLAAPACVATDRIIVTPSHTCHTVFYHLPMRRGPPRALIAQ